MIYIFTKKKLIDLLQYAMSQNLKTKKEIRVFILKTLKELE